MSGGASRKGPRITTILVAMVAGVASLILAGCIILFLIRYREAMVSSARTSTAQAVAQVSDTVGNYLRDMEQAMGLVEQSMSKDPRDRDSLLSTCLLYTSPSPRDS